MSEAKHTSGPLESRVDFAAIGKGNQTIARVYFGEGRSTHECEDTNRLLTAAYNSYDKHCGPRAVECAEGNLLGELLRVCRLLVAAIEDWGDRHLDDWLAREEYEEGLPAMKVAIAKATGKEIDKDDS